MNDHDASRPQSPATNSPTTSTSNTAATAASTPAASATPAAPLLPHHKLLAYGVARDLLLAVQACAITDPVLRDHALRSAKSAALDCAEGAGRVSPRDKARSFAIARAECVEAAAAVEIACLTKEARPEPAREVARLTHHLVGMLTRLIR